ncbi:MAG: hypothetical protein IJP55_07595, partial [Bacteroidales bacterium]|nr:hypothetical protein [Bacteroidales bacterium]
SLTAAQSGLQTAPVRRMRWTYHHLFQSSEVLLSSGQLNKSSSRDTRFSAKIAGPSGIILPIFAGYLPISQII